MFPHRSRRSSAWTPLYSAPGRRAAHHRHLVSSCRDSSGALEYDAHHRTVPATRQHRSASRASIAPRATGCARAVFHRRATPLLEFATASRSIRSRTRIAARLAKGASARGRAAELMIIETRCGSSAARQRSRGCASQRGGGGGRSRTAGSSGAGGCGSGRCGESRRGTQDAAWYSLTHQSSRLPLRIHRTSLPR